MNFYQRAITEMAAEIAPGARDAVEAQVIKAYKATPAHGVSDEDDVKSLWDELGALLAEDHPLREIALGGLRTEVHAAVNELDSAKSLALWIAYGSAVDFLDANELDEYGNMADDSDGTENVVNHVCRRITNAALSDWEERTPRADDEAHLQALIDGTADMFDPGILGRLEPMFARYEGEAHMQDLLDRAALAYSDAAMAAARDALNSQAFGDSKRDLARPAAGHPDTGSDTADQVADEGDPLAGIVILSVHDKDGNRHPELEDDIPGGAPRR